MSHLDPAATTSSPPKRRPLFLAGVLLFVLGPAIYFVQIGLQNLAMPWYLPGLSLIGVACMFASVWQRRGALRIAGLALFVLLCGFEWYIVLVASKTPRYTGPAQPGVKIPEFSTTLADGTIFTNQNLESDSRAILVFNRGRW